MGRVDGSRHVCAEITTPADPEAVVAECIRLVLPPGQNADVGDLREMAGEDAPDRARSHDAYTFDYGHETADVRLPWPQL
jgi:hypothetical protein